MRRTPRRAAAAVLAAVAVLAADDLAAQPTGSLHTQISAAVASTAVPRRTSTPDRGEAPALRRIYEQRADAPLWSVEGRTTPQAQSLLHELQGADAYGLEVEDYSGAGLGKLSETAAAAGADDARWAQFDVKLSAAALRFMSDLHYGRVDPAAAGFRLQAAHAPLDLADALGRLATSADVRATLASVEPPFHHYHLLKDALGRYRSLAQQPELTQLPAPPAKLKPGDAYSGAPALRRLLIALGDLPAVDAAQADAPTFDAGLSAAVRSFQQRHGLEADGIPGKATFVALTTPLAHRVRQIDLTLERWRWLPPFQTPPIIVNIPQFRLFAFRTTEDRVADILQMNVIVGKVFPRMQTPVFESDMRYVVIRPYWDVPRSILKNEMLPKIRVNPGYLAAQRLEIVSGDSDSSPVLPPTPANIEALAAGKLRVRQKPGEDNALGLVKFMFPNNYNVYLHSTPAHRLFQETVRTFSHGCIRVSDPLALAVEVLKDAPGGWDRQKIDAAMHDDKTIRVNLTRPINVLILYGTALATEAGPVLFFHDIYGYDKRLERELGLKPGS